MLTKEAIGESITDRLTKGWNFLRYRLQCLTLLSPLVMAALSGCGGEQPPYNTLLKPPGDWNKTDVETLATAMETTSLSDLVQAGQILMGNQEGQPTISRLSSMFSDAQIRVTTVDRFNAPKDYPDKRAQKLGAPAAASIIRDGLKADIFATIAGSSQQVKLTTYNRLRLDQIILDRRFLGNKSDFLTEFLTAKEVLNVEAFDKMTDFFAPHIFVLPPDPITRNSLRVKLLDADLSTPDQEVGIPGQYIGDIWAHFILIPDYLEARDRVMFGPHDQEDNMLNLFDFSARHFQDDGILLKRQDGGYYWSGDQERVYKSWMLVTEALYTTGT